MMPFVYPGRPATILISQHRDGEYITRIAERLGFAVERGSATRGGARAFRQLVHALKEGRNVVVTPDGPKGPPRRVKSGVVELSRLSGMPIVPVAFGAHPADRPAKLGPLRDPVPWVPWRVRVGIAALRSARLSKTEAARFQSLLADRLDGVTAAADRLARCPAAREA